MEVLLVSPMRPCWSSWLRWYPYMVMGFVILTAILLMAYSSAAKCRSRAASHLIYLLSMLYILLALSLGLLISTVADTQMTALLSSLLVLLMPCLFLSGMVFPIGNMPCTAMDNPIVPPRYYVEAMRKLIMGTGFCQHQVDNFVLLAITVALMSQL